MYFYGGKVFVLSMCLKQFCLGTTKFGGHKRSVGETAPEFPLRRTLHWSYASATTHKNWCNSVYHV